MTARDSSPIGVGVITVFMILIVLCLSTFAALTYVSARADYRLSRINADTVAAYYEADARAAKLAAEFAGGSAAELEQTIAITDTQALYLRLSRREDGSVAVLAWRTVTLEDGGGWGSDPLPVWGG